MGSAVRIALLSATLMIAIGTVAYDVEVQVRTLPDALVTFIVGASAFAALGLALAACAPTGASAPPVANATILPLAFISDVFMPIEDPPA